MTEEELKTLLAKGETLTVEFKSDRQQISDKDIYEEVVALASTEGGTLLIGVDDSGKVVGANERHHPSTDPFRLQAAIFGNTVHAINTRVSAPVNVVEAITYGKRRGNDQEMNATIT